MLTNMNYFNQAIKLLLQPGVKRYVFIPLFLNILIYISFISCAYHYTQELHSWLASYTPHWLSAVAWIVWFVSFIGILFFFTYLFTTIANIVAAPFNGFLAEKVEESMLGHTPNNAITIKQLCLLLPKTLIRQMQLLLYFLPRAIILLALFLIPGINIVAGILWFLFSSWMISLQYFDYPFDNNNVGFKSMLNTLKQSPWQYLQFGIIINIFSIMPVINLFVIPFAVISATVIWAEKHSEMQGKLKNAITKNL